MHTNKKNNRELARSGAAGFTLFIAIVITGTLLLVSVSIISLSVKESFLSASVRESQSAFYAADTGAECAIFWDIKNPSQSSAFGTSTPIVPISCLGASVTPSRSAVINNNATSTFQLNNAQESSCAIISVAKTNDGKTKIESLGYNTCSLTNPRRVERAVRVTY